jgi:DNA modification methylase
MQKEKRTEYQFDELAVLEYYTNNLVLDDSFKVLLNLPDRCVDLVLTDVPYDLKQNQKEFLHEQFIRIANYWVIVFSPPENQWILPAEQYGFWMKPISTKNTSKRYSRFIEMIFFYGYGTWNCDRHWSQYTNVFTDLVDTSKIHPFRKPPSLIERLILNHTNEGDVILDPFAGSGVVPIVAKRLGRSFIGIENDPDYFELANQELSKTSYLFNENELEW